MPPRTRRTTVGKEGGGILASLSNTPAIKDRTVGSAKKQRGKRTPQKDDEVEESPLNTPPPMKSVVLEKSNTDFSPLTQTKLRKQGNKKSVRRALQDDEASSHESEHDEEDSTAISTDSLPPIKVNQSFAKRRIIVESSDEETAEMDEVDENQNPDLSFPGHADDDNDDDSNSDDVSVDLQTEDEESEYASESEADEIDEEESEEFEEDDDEYVPDDEDENSSSDEELSEYVEEDKIESRKHGLRRNIAQREAPEVEASMEDDDVCSDEELQAEDTIETRIQQTTEMSMPAIEALTLEEPDDVDCAVIDDDEYGDILLATVVEADDDDYDDDVLIATIVNDDDGEKCDVAIDDGDECSECEEEQSQCADDSVSTSEPLEMDDAEAVENRQTCHEATDRAVRNQQESQMISKENISDISGSYKVVEEIQDKVISKKSLTPQRVPEDRTIFDVDHQSPVVKERKARKSFFRAEGIIKRGKWKLGSKIGLGSFGTVHVGMNNQTGKLMAVKVFKIDEAVMEDIRREIELMRSLDHQNIVRYLGAEMDTVHMHIFQEWVPGGSVATLLGRFGPFSLQVIQSYISQTLAGLAYLHDHDIIHRDIKGSNILVNDDGVVKLADFGASKKLHNLRANLMMSMTVRGTPYFMSPEVFEEKYSAKADIWGIGCVAYQMMTGVPPWKEEGFTNPISLFNHIKRHVGPPVLDRQNTDRLVKEDKNVFHFLDDLLQLCFDKDPSKRPDAIDLVHHAFFTKMHHDDEEAAVSTGLFSPTNSTSATPKHESREKAHLSPAQIAMRQPTGPAVPTPSAASRSKSVVKWRTTFSSPPRSSLKNNLAASPFQSPAPDTSSWPEWAQAALEKRNLFSRTPKQGPNPESDDEKVRAMMDSLALSSDSTAAGSRQIPVKAPGRESNTSTSADQSGLVGLNLLETSYATFEI